MMKTSRLISLAAIVAATLPVAPALAHRQWIMPSQTSVEDEGAYVTVDAAVSESLFDFDSFPLKLDGITITGPDGLAVQPETVSTGKRRSTFDLKLAKAGTYRIALVTGAANGTYMVGTEQKRFRGTEAELATAIPKDATDIRITRTEGRLESFVTVGDPTDTVLKPVGKGLEIIPVTSPTENVVGTPAKFRALVDGKPAADIDITIVPGGGRFRANLGDMSVKTDAKGEISVNWPMAGMMWIGASWPPRPAGMPEGGPGAGGPGAGGPGAGGPGAGGPGAGGPGAGGPGGPGARGPVVPRRLSYAATYEVQPF